VPTRSRGQRRAAPRSSGPFVHDWQAPGTVGWLAQAKCAQNRADTFALPLLARSVDSHTLAPENGFASRGLPERTETYRRHDLPHARWWSRGESSQARDQAHPDIGLSFSPLSSLASRFCCWGSCADKRLLHRASQPLPALGQDGQHRLQIQPSSSLIAAPLPSPWLWDDGRGPLRWCPEPAARGVSSQSARVSVANEAASVRELVTSSSSEPPVQGYRLFPGLHLGGQGRRSMLGHARGRFHSSCCSPNIFELAGSKGLFRPAFCVQKVLRVHLPILAACYMCIKDSLLGTGYFTKHGVVSQCGQCTP
jgi:hypothetical protein